MNKYRATAYNDNGMTFNFNFYNVNWNGIEEAAKIKLAKIISNDSLHSKYAPWNITNIDRSA